MDNILDKIGLYDFLGLLLPGMWFVVMLYLLGIPVMFECSIVSA